MTVKEDCTASTKKYKQSKITDEKLIAEYSTSINNDSFPYIQALHKEWKKPLDISKIPYTVSISYCACGNMGKKVIQSRCCVQFSI